MTTKKTPKILQIFLCEHCNFKCCKKSDFNRHISTAKHKRALNDNNLTTENNEKAPHCICGNIYKDRAGLWRHKKKCLLLKNNELKSAENSENAEKNTNINITDKDAIFQIIQQNKELQDLLVEQNKIMMEQNNKLLEMCKEKTIITTNNTTNSHNKTFNLQVFLNETCKDAMNIMDFVESLQIQISDLENVGKVGYVDGISNIIVKNLKALDVSKRPIHCSDLKREVLYVKDQDKWEKDNEDKDKLRKAIKQIAHKNIKMIPSWKELNPKYILDEGKANDEYIQIVMKSMGGSDKAQDIAYENKIISKLAKSVMIHKDMDLI